MNHTYRLPRPLRALLSLLVLAAAFAEPARAQVSLTTLGVPHTQNFDGLANAGTNIAWTDNTTIAGWYATRVTYNAGTGSSNTGAMYSFGVAGVNPVTDRALGGVASGGTGTFYWAARFVNNTGSTITSVDVSYAGEQWRDGGNATPAAQTMAFQYQVANAGVITDADTPAAGWVNAGIAPAGGLDFTSPIFTTVAAALDGNSGANRLVRTASITGLSVAAGQEIWIRWQDQNDTGNDHGLSIDDLSVTPQGAGGGVTLSINDVTQVEGNVGTTVFAFTVSLSGPAPVGGVTFDIATADGGATLADNDYVLNSLTGQTIAAGNTTYPFNVTVNGDTTPEPNETFFVNVTNVTNATVADGQGLGTITNDDVTITRIHDIQGNGTSSPLVSAVVTTRGIVTALKGNGFFLQEPDAGVDADPNTSEGIFVFTSVAPPAQAVVGNDLTLTATVTEFVPSADPLQPPVTELTTPGSYVVNSSGNPLPTATPITSGMMSVNSIENLEFLEGMRVSVASLTAIAPTQGFKTESSATSVTNGVFYAVVTGTARPFREAGIQANDPAPSGGGVTICPTGAPTCVPRFDFNPERLRVDSDALTGTTAIDVNTGATITGITGVLDYAFRTWTILPYASPVPVVAGGMTATPVPLPTNQEFTIASYNVERFYDTTDDPGISDVALTPAAFNNRLAKVSDAIRNYLRFPDVIGFQEVENLATLQAIATKVSTDAVANAQPDPQYVAYLSEGNDVGGIDVGFLVRTGSAAAGSICGGSTAYTGARVVVGSVTQFNLSQTYVNPCTGASDLLNDRPPLVLVATIHNCNGSSIAVTVVNNHLRSLGGVDDETTTGCAVGTNGNRVRVKRRAQAESLANLIQARQTGDPTERIVVLGDFNAFEVNDGYVDSMGTILGAPTPAGQVTLESVDIVTPNLTPLDPTPPPAERYSYTFDGSAQSLDHVLINQALVTALASFRAEHARVDADFAEVNRNNATATRLSDHDPTVGFFNFSPPFPVELTGFTAE